MNMSRFSSARPGESIGRQLPALFHLAALRKANRAEALLRDAGYALTPVADAHLCCGSAGTYSLLQGELSRSLRARKLESLRVAKPDLILSANIGCITHLAAASDIPVWHWIEWVDRALAGATG